MPYCALVRLSVSRFPHLKPTAHDEHVSYCIMNQQGQLASLHSQGLFAIQPQMHPLSLYISLDETLGENLVIVNSMLLLLFPSSPIFSASLLLCFVSPFSSMLTEQISPRPTPTISTESERLVVASSASFRGRQATAKRDAPFRPHESLHSGLFDAIRASMAAVRQFYHGFRVVPESITAETAQA